MRHSLRIALVLVGLGFAGQAIAQDCNGNGVDDARDIAASFRGLGDLPGGDFYSRATDISADGSIVVGFSSTATDYEAFRWTSDGGMVGLGLLPGLAPRCKGFGISADGSVVVGECGYPPYESQAFRWTAGGGMEALDPLPRYPSTATAVSADGQVVVGYDCLRPPPFPGSHGFCEAFRWTSTEGPADMGNLSSASFDTRALGVSADGSVVVGFSGTDTCTTGFRWTVNGGMMGLDLPACGAAAYNVSADGSVVVGEEYSGGGGYPSVFRWTAAGGTVDLGDLPDGLGSVPTDLTPNGAVIVGWSQTTTGEKAFHWDAVNGMRSLQALLADDYGVDLTGWTLVSAEGISADGRSIVGTGTNPDGLYEAWIATLPSSADCNANGVPDECDQDCNANGVPDDCETWVTVPLDIRPGACPNILSRPGRGLLPVALLGTDGFDVNDVNVATVRLSRAGCVGESAAPEVGPNGVNVAMVDVGTPHDGATCSCHGRGGDREPDLVMPFRTDDITARLRLDDDPSGAPVELVVTGELNDGTPFIGADCVQLVPRQPLISGSRSQTRRRLRGSKDKIGLRDVPRP